MGTTLDALIQTKTQLDQRTELLTAASGLGVPQNLGYGDGQIALTGTPLGTYQLVVTIISSAGGTAVTFTYSLDGGVTTSAPVTPTAGAYVVPSTGVTINFTAPSSGSFLAGDIFTVNTFAPPMPVSAWQPGDVGLTLIEIFAAALVVVRNLIKKIAAGGLLKLARGGWLTVLADNFYDVQRASGQPTQGTVALNDTMGAGPFNITPGSLLLTTASGLRYRSNQTITLPVNGSINLAVVAENIGFQYNVGGQAINALGTPLPGVTVTNGINWITQQGTNDEADADLIARCLGKWSSLAFALTQDAYAYWAKLAAPGSVTRAQSVVDSDPTHPGRVLLYVAAASGPVSPANVAAVQAAVFPRVPITGDLLTIAAPASTFTLTGSVMYFASYSATIQLAVNTALISFFSTIPVGGVVYFSRLVAAIQNVPGVSEVILSYPLADGTLTAGQVAAYIDSLSYVPV